MNTFKGEKVKERKQEETSPETIFACSWQVLKCKDLVVCWSSKISTDAARDVGARLCEGDGKGKINLHELCSNGYLGRL